MVENRILNMKDKYWLIIIIGSIFFFGFLALLEFNSLGKSLNNFSFPEFNFNADDFSFHKNENVTQKNFTEEKIELFYPSDWKPVENSLLDEGILREDSQTLLFLQKLNLDNPFFAFLSIQKIKTNQSIEEYLNSSAEKIKDNDVGAEIVKKNIGEDFALLEIKYYKEENTILYGTEKLISVPEFIYIIDVISPTEPQGEINEEIDQIIDSFKKTQSS